MVGILGRHVIEKQKFNYKPQMQCDAFHLIGGKEGPLAHSKGFIYYSWGCEVIHRAEQEMAVKGVKDGPR